MTAFTETDPWGFGDAEPDQKWHDRESRVHAAALAEHNAARLVSIEYCDFDKLPNDVQRDYISSARIVLDTAYPKVEFTDEIEALPLGTVIVSEHGMVRVRVAVSAAIVDGSQVGSSKPWDTPGIPSRERSRDSSEALSYVGPWTVVHGVIA